MQTKSNKYIRYFSVTKANTGQTDKSKTFLFLSSCVIYLFQATIVFNKWSKATYLPLLFCALQPIVLSVSLKINWKEAWTLDSAFWYKITVAIDHCYHPLRRRVFSRSKSVTRLLPQSVISESILGHVLIMNSSSVISASIKALEVYALLECSKVFN